MLDNVPCPQAAPLTGPGSRNTHHPDTMILAALATALDREGWPEVAGTIAGDDTVLAISPDEAGARRLRDRLLGLMG